MRCIFLACLILSVVQAFKVPVVRCNDLSIKLCARLPFALKDRSTDSLSQAPQPIFERIDYLVTDSTELPEEERPSFISAVSNPRDLQALLLLFSGLLISASNVIGSYGEMYISLEETAIYLGVLNGLAGIIQQLTGYQITRSGRAGIADDGLVTFFGGIYSSAVTWLAWRASAACPLWLPKYDQLASAAAISAFTFGIIVPAVTLCRDSSHNQTSIPSLSVTEKLRVKGILALGVLGAVFIPDCIAFGSGGETWCLHAVALHPAQQTLESSTALFALFATEASMIAHRCAKKGVAPVSKIVPLFFWVSVALAIFPCAAALWWLGSDISFFSYYRE